MTPATHSLHKQRFMYLGYVDDSGSTGCNLDDKQCHFQVVGGPIIEEKLYAPVEVALAWSVEEIIPPEQWDDFEFHAFDLFHANKPFDSIGLEKCRSLLSGALEWIRKFKIPILYGAIDKVKLKSEIFRTAKPVDMAFRLYLEALDEWFEKTFDPEQTTTNDCWPHAIIVADDSRKEVRNEMQRALHDVLRKPKAGQWVNGLGMYVFDDLYFGDSKNSTGLQIADICVYIIARHLAGKPDAKGFYDIISDQIFSPRIFPK